MDALEGLFKSVIAIKCGPASSMRSSSISSLDPVVILRTLIKLAIDMLPSSAPAKASIETKATVAITSGSTPTSTPTITTGTSLISPSTSATSSTTSSGIRAAMEKKEDKRMSGDAHGPHSTTSDTKDSSNDGHSVVIAMDTSGIDAQEIKSKDEQKQVIQRLEQYFGWVREHLKQRKEMSSSSRSTNVVMMSTSASLDERIDDIRWFAEQAWNIG
jgi:hypothetical protein